MVMSGSTMKGNWARAHPQSMRVSCPAAQKRASLYERFHRDQKVVRAKRAVMR
jgi:hypothetical protein